MWFFSKRCSIAVKKSDVGQAIETLISQKVNYKINVYELRDRDAYVYEFDANMKTYDAIIDKLRPVVLIPYRDNFDRVTYQGLV